MTTITTYTYEPTRDEQGNWHEEWKELDLEVKFTKRDYGGWLVKRADNGRPLGWVVKSEYGEDAGKWTAHVNSGAFRGTSVDDEGDVLDTVPLDLFNGDSPLTARPIVLASTRLDAAWEIVTWLRNKHAPALGYGKHYRVTPWR